MVRWCHVVVVGGFCALPAFGGPDRGTCHVAGGSANFCDPKGVACTASDGKSGTCVQRVDGCECAPHNICHFDKSTHSYVPIRVSGISITTHLRHGDCRIDDGVNCTIDRCDRILGCVHSPDNARCDDGNACTTDSCSAVTGCVRDPLPDCDGDGICDAVDLDDDNDGVVDADDSADCNPSVCADTDSDTCDDCSGGSFDPNNDGLDCDGDGICDAGDLDDDNDGVDDADDSADCNPSVCSDTDSDTCDDCSGGSFDPNNDGPDGDGDGICDAGDNCPNVANADQADADGNGVGDACTRPPVNPNVRATLTEDEVKADATLQDFKLANAIDPDGDDLDVQSLDSSNVTATINGQDVSADFSFDIAGFFGTLKHLATSVATFTVDSETGTETITSLDDAFWDSLDDGDSVVVVVGYTVTDGSLTDSSTQSVTINGVNDAPNCSVDPDGDDVDIQSLDSALVTVTIDGVDASADFSSEIAGNVVTLKYLGNSVATLTFDFETGNQTFLTLDDGFWASLDDGDSVVVKIDYTITDGTATAACSTQITINGVNDAPIDADEAFVLGEDDAVSALFLGNKLANAFDPDGDVLIMLSIDAATSDTSGVGNIGVLPNFAVTLVDGAFNDGDGAEIAISTDAGTASLLIDSNGNETMTDPNNIFNPLQGSDVLRIMVDYTISDDGGFTESSRQTITINGVCDPSCGDGVCGCGEDAASCPSDCSCAALDACGGTAPGGCFCDCGCFGRADCCPDAESACNLSQTCCDNRIVLTTDLQPSVGAGGPQTAYYLYVNGQFGSLENIDDWVLSITASNGGSTALVNPSTVGMGVSNNLFEKSSTLNEVFHFEFDDEHASPVGGTTPNLVDTAVIRVAGLDAGEQIQYVAQYTDGTQSSIITITSADLSATGTFDINAPVGKYLDSIDLSAGPSTTVVRITALTAEICIQSP